MVAPATETAVKIQTTCMDISPDLAAQWLEGNARNRRVDQKHVDMLAKEMEAGRWRVTHQGIAFDSNGSLIDGQHRLWAVFQSGCTVRMAVSFGLSPDSIDTIDGGKSRSVVDRMALTGAFGDEGINKHHAATLREMVRGVGAAARIPYFRQVELMKLHADAIRFANTHVATSARGIGVAYVRAVIARAWYSVDEGELVRFCEILSTGMSSDAGDGEIIKLRDALISAAGTRNRAIQHDLYRKVASVLVAWLKGNVRSAMRPVTREHFLIPEEVED